MTEDCLVTRELSCGYGKLPVVRDINLRVRQGEVVALLGPNGAGKTTTLLTLSRLLPILGGEATILGRQLASIRNTSRLVRMGLGHVPEDRGLFRNLNPDQHLRLAGGKDESAYRFVLERLPALELVLHRRAGLLSGGEQQMVALGRSLIRRPKVLLIDEMSTGLAPIIVTNLLKTVRSLADEEGVGILMVEQHSDLALGAADRAYVMSHGHIVDEDDAKVLLKDRRRLESSYLGESSPALEPSGATHSTNSTDPKGSL